MSKELAKNYNPKDMEQRLYQKWEDKGYFHAVVDKSKTPFTIVMPPPNITGQLHIGHALDDTLQDILIRYKRMAGFNALWQPGTDHAAIATELKLVEALRAEGIEKEDLGREKFLERAWEWKSEYGGRIINQLKKMGFSADWERERFTLDEGCSAAVEEVFLRLHEKGYIYRGNRIINWCPVCKTTLSDAEVEHIEQEGNFWHIRYPVADAEGTFVEIATTRPETMLGDTAVAVHPEDERFTALIGKSLILPLTGREIPIVADSYVDREFGTGAVKITPAHDPNDFELGKRHDLPVITILNDDGTINGNGGKYAGLERYAARAAIVKDLEEQGFLVQIKAHTHNVGTHDRCRAVVEPLVKPQWFVAMEELAKPAIAAIETGELKFVPERMSKVYLNWLLNIRDWCISRQLWWGHRIPAYYCDSCGMVHVGKIAPKRCEKCGNTAFTQDEDTLDTWFSSALWPFSTLGWPQKTEDLDYFYPTDVLVTAYDIIFFWVVRMVFSGYEHTGKSPFQTVFIHGLLRDSQGRKMSKSLGNGVDPLEIVEQYGADALRLTLVTGNAPGNDIRFHMERVEASRNFANKVWNASRFILMSEEALNGQNVQGGGIGSDAIVSGALKGLEVAQAILSQKTAPGLELPKHLDPIDKWILSKVNRLAREVTDNMDRFELGIAADKVYDFIWDEFCDWYIELAKQRIYKREENQEGAKTAISVLRVVLSQALKLLHPFMPFVTEEIYCTLHPEEESIMIADWPVYKEEWNFPKEEGELEKVKELVRGVRNLRAETGAAPSKKISLLLLCEDGDTAFLYERLKASYAPLLAAEEIKVMTKADAIHAGVTITEDMVSVVTADMTAYIPLADLVDFEKERERLQKEKERLQKELARSDAMLSNDKFIGKAPAAKIKEEEDKRAKYRQMMEQVEERLKALGE